MVTDVSTMLDSIPQRVSIELLGDFPTPWKILRRFVQITVLHYRISFFYIQRIRDAMTLGFPLKQSSNNIKNTFTFTLQNV